jgi:uncharacterized repeat protein (TIGR03803 family)
MKFPATTFGIMLFAFTSMAKAQTFTPLYDFQGGSDGGNPFSTLVRDSSGSFYGTTLNGGNLQTCAYPGCGIVYKLDAAGNETPIYTFAGPPGDGGHPVAGVITDAAGNFYGTTKYGGASGYGTVFQISPKGVEKLLRVFTGGTDGGIPNAGLIRDKSGDLYGTTYVGGNSGFGTVFEITPSGAFSTLYSFPDRAHGTNPNAALLRDASGNLYGTTQYGGDANRGTVFKLDPSGDETVLYSFSGTPDGAYPQSQLVADADGNLYGTTTEGGAANAGSVFRLTLGGTESVLYNFAGSPDGAYPMAGVVRDASGNLYGTTFRGGSSSTGVVYKIDPLGHETLLYSFRGIFDGASPAAALLLDPKGASVYGTAESSGFFCCGAVFQVSLP